jgi:hypothetical protein
VFHRFGDRRPPLARRPDHRTRAAPSHHFAFALSGRLCRRTRISAFVYISIIRLHKVLVSSFLANSPVASSHHANHSSSSLCAPCHGGAQLREPSMLSSPCQPRLLPGRLCPAGALLRDRASFRLVREGDGVQKLEVPRAATALIDDPALSSLSFISTITPAIFFHSNLQCMVCHPSPLSFFTNLDFLH